jgi:mannan endo-1,4-beta-mannosidase
MMPVTQEMTASDSEIENARSWAKEGGIVSYMWHWADPIGGEKYYADETDFDLSKAVTAEDIALLPIDEIEKLCEEKKISSECLAIVKDIDAVSAELAKLRDDGIAVIWRPLHEASNGYFWWGHDAESYKWLWKLLYQRQTGYHKLSNLIWVWSAQNSGWYVGDDMCDIISADIYDKGNLSGHAERLVFLKKICATKPIVMSECGTTPGIQQLADERALWGFIGQWGGSFLMNADSSINEEYNSPDDLTDFYSNDLTITREELPDFSARAKELEGADKKAADEAQKAATATTTTAAETVPPADSQTTTTTATTAASAAS